MQVSEVMSRDPAWCTRTCTATNAARLMQSRNCGMLPVIEGWNDRTVVGVVTDRDLCLSVVATGKDAMHVAVNDLMTVNPVCCNRDDNVHQAAMLMAGARVRRIVVVDHAGRLQGVLSLTDLLEYEAVTREEVAYVLMQMDAKEKSHAGVASAT